MENPEAKKGAIAFKQVTTPPTAHHPKDVIVKKIAPNQVQIEVGQDSCEPTRTPPRSPPERNTT